MSTIVYRISVVLHTRVGSALQGPAGTGDDAPSVRRGAVAFVPRPLAHRAGPHSGQSTIAPVASTLVLGAGRKGRR